MGYSTETPFFSDQVDPINSELKDIKREFLEQGWQNVDFAFNLGRKTGAIDVKQKDRRLLIYKSDPSDQQTTQLLTVNNIPRFETVKTVDVNDDKIVALKVPLETKALDSMTFPDQEPKTGHLGSFEMIDSTAKLLAAVIARTNHIPTQVKLQHLALIPPNEFNNIIRIIPPYNFAPVKDPNQAILQISNQLKNDLENQDPYSNHEKQITFFMDRIATYLKNKDNQL